MKQFFGIFLLLFAIAVVGVFTLLKKADEANQIVVSGLAGSEKIAFLENPKVQDILRTRYNISVDVSKKGSVAMVRNPTPGHDFLWPAGDINVEMYKHTGGSLKKVESLFHSPIVFYSWNRVVDGLMNDSSSALINQEGNVYYLSNPEGLFKMMTEGKKWKDLDLNLFGSVVVKSTDPTKSNSGNMYGALLANTMNNNQVVTDADVDNIKETVKQIFQRQGHMEGSSGVLFQHFVNQGEGAFPIIVGYENQLIEFSNQHPDAIQVIRDRLRILYPQPTVWASHPMIAVTENGEALLAALRDEEIQKLAWEEHGFRSGGVGGQNDPSIFSINGFPKTISSVMPTPNANVMTRLIEHLSGESHAPEQK